MVYYAANAIITRYKTLAKIDQHREDYIKIYGENFVLIREEIKRILKKREYENKLYHSHKLLSKKKKAKLQNQIQQVRTDQDIRDMFLPPLMVKGVRIRPELTDEQIAKLLRKEFYSLSSVKDKDNYLRATLGPSRTDSVYAIIAEEERLSAERAERRAREKAQRKLEAQTQLAKKGKSPSTQSPKDKKETNSSGNLSRAFAATYSEEDRVSRKAMEIFEKMKEVGFHKCGKSFTCSCCGEIFLQNQGIVSDVGEIYLCNRCRAGQKGRERKSKSVYAIPTPMGGQNK